MYDAELYRSKEEVERWKQRDPISTFANSLRVRLLLSDDDWTAMEAAVAAEVADAVTMAEAGQYEPVQDLLKDVLTCPT
jgi:TPP-dependent pyruvate/acetoin dehydrogenase alpha subunit